ncbi:hypothetical protein E1B28_005574 [Marasmius oreades]|uniref:Uncharacterized protein n=1 Tax=Marasmius oreades TaxID=181124 RepID=A0A9P7UUQ5_9AGAR|nr:uncharacterized protein E1B28_005574 [Marasmius oreades]KAG7094758.1 hypothetical protein E1B28_005574 [Marasmius oreades]
MFRIPALTLAPTRRHSLRHRYDTLMHQHGIRKGVLLTVWWGTWFSGLVVATQNPGRSWIRTSKLVWWRSEVATAEGNFRNPRRPQPPRLTRTFTNSFPPTECDVVSIRPYE